MTHLAAATPLDMIWLAICTALVFLMQAGFMCVEAGITRAKNNISVAIKNVADLSLSVTLFWLVGFGLMFGPSVGGFFGTGPFAVSGDLGPADYAHLAYQAMFCGAAATILSGAVAERCSFHGYLIVTALTAVLFYPLMGHWAWATDELGAAAGWLGALGFHDYAGAGVVHGLGGGVALAAILVLGPRDGRFLNSGGSRRFNGSNLPLAMLGALLLWLGWFGFNGGGAGGWTDQTPGVLFKTLVGGVAGVIAGLGVSWLRDGKPNVFYGMNGALAGLVAVTGGCDVFTIRGAFTAGLIGGLIAYFGDKALERARIDDAVGATPVHLMAGIWGLLAVAILGDAEALGGSALALLPAQAAGAAAILAFGVALPYLVFRLIDRALPLRVTAHIEAIGLNVGEHGANTDLNELFEVMQRQTRERDLSIRAPQSPFTEVGQIGLFYNSVMFELERSFTRLQSQQDELAAAVDQKNALLESVLPKSVVTRMNDGESQIVDQIADATVVFVDIVDFTAFSMQAPPSESMVLLQTLFRAFDGVIGKYGLEKIKTIGDCYMFVSGVPTGGPDQCARAVDAALDLLFEVRQVSVKLGRDIQVRIGVHSGPVVAGVVGEFRYVYDLWGSTVNIASRIEEVGRPNKVTVSQAVVDRLGGDFICQKVGRSRLRSVGATVLHQVEGRRQTASRGNAG